MSTRRFHGLDLIRLLSFFAIATFHVSLIHYHTKAIAIAEESLVIKATEQLSRVLSFSGFTICFLTAILTAYSGNRIVKRIRLFAFLFIGWIVFSALVTGLRDEPLVWDIYPLIFLGVLLASLGELIGPRLLVVMGLVGFSMLWIPFWNFVPEEMVVADWHRVLGFVSTCDQGSVEWPIFPWIGLVWFGYAAGAFTRGALRLARGKTDPLAMTRSEAGLWGVLLAGSIPFLGSFYRINLGEYFACEAYRQEPVTFWAHFIWPVFLIRISFVPQVEAWLARRRFSTFVAKLAISRKFWLAYITNYLQAHVLSYIVTNSGVEQTDWNVPTIALIAVGSVPLTEVLVRGELWLADRALRMWRSLASRRGPVAVGPGERGAGLIAAILALSVVGLMIAGLTNYLSGQIEARSVRNLIDGRNLAYDVARASAIAPDALYVSSLAAPNAPLGRCTGLRPGACAARRWTPFTLFAPFARTPATARSVQMSGRTQAEAGGYYTNRGLRAPCSPGPLCPYWARTWFYAECPGNAGTCARAVKIWTRAQVVTHGLANLKGGLQISRFPPDSTFAATFGGAASVFVTDIRGSAIQACPAGAYASGIINGTLKCHCSQGFRQVGSDPVTGWPSCDPIVRCAPHEVLGGMMPDGTAYCYTPPATVYDCDPLAQTTRGNARCPGPDDKMRQVIVGAECEVISNKVNCPDLKISCCRKR